MKMLPIRRYKELHEYGSVKLIPDLMNSLNISVNEKIRAWCSNRNQGLSRDIFTDRSVISFQMEVNRSL